MYRTAGSDTSHAEKSSSFVETFLRTCIKRVIHAPPFYEFPAKILLEYTPYGVIAACFLFFSHFYHVPRMSLPFSRRRIAIHLEHGDQAHHPRRCQTAAVDQLLGRAHTVPHERDDVRFVLIQALRQRFCSRRRLFGSGLRLFCGSGRRCSACCSRLRMSSQHFWQPVPDTRRSDAETPAVPPARASCRYTRARARSDWSAAQPRPWRSSHCTTATAARRSDRARRTHRGPDQARDAR